MVKTKKGYFQFLEMALVIMLTTAFFFMFFPRAEVAYLKHQDMNGLQKTGFGMLKSLDETAVFSAYTSATNFASSNFTVMKLYIKSGLPSTVDSQIEYAVNITTCFSEDGASGSCGLKLENTTKEFDVVRAHYTYTKKSDPVTIRLYLWRIL